MPDRARSDVTEPAEGSTFPSTRLAETIARETARQLAMPLSPGLHLIATPIGNLGDVTVRALTTLARADLVCCEDTRHSRTLLAHFGIERPLRPYHEHNADAERPRLLSMLNDGKAIALISDAGTPLVSDPGYKLVREAVAAGVAVHALPGPSAVLAGLALSGLPTDTFLFAGFLPPKEAARRSRLTELSNIPATLVLFEAPQRLADTLADIAAVLGARQTAVCRELTKRFEEVRRGSAADLETWARSGGVKGEIVIVIEPPGTQAATDADIETALARAMEDLSLRDAARVVAEAMGAPRSRVYEIGLRLRNDR